MCNSKKDVKISDLHELLSAGKIIWTEHLSFRMNQRGIKREDVIACIKNGEIIEHYPEA